jgi:hypothetical protein
MIYSQGGGNMRNISATVNANKPVIEDNNSNYTEVAKTMDRYLVS